MKRIPRISGSPLGSKANVARSNCDMITYPRSPRWTEEPCGKCGKVSDAVRFVKVVDGKSVTICSRCEGKLRKEKRR